MKYTEDATSLEKKIESSLFNLRIHRLAPAKIKVTLKEIFSLLGFGVPRIKSIQN